MKPSSIATKLEQILDINKKEVQEGGQVQEVEEETIEINEQNILNNSQGCKSLNQVVRLRLMGQKISQLEKLELVPQLKSLNISFTNLKKINGMNKLKELKDAILSNNEIEGISGLEENKQLVSLNLSYNKINDIQNVNHLTKLTVLNLSSNNISLIQGIDNLKNLTHLFLEDNKIKKIDFFPQMTSLEEISLKNNQIESIHPKLFENLKNLQELNLSNNKIRSLEFMNSLPNLEKFNCSSNMIERAFMKIQFEYLEHLDLSNNQILETKKFGEYFPNLFSLDVSNNNIFTEDELVFVYEMDSLCEIDFSNNLVCSADYMEQFLRRHPEIDVVNGKIVNSAGHRFEVEMKEVEEEIKELEKKENVLNLAQQLSKDGSLTEEEKLTKQILKSHNISDLPSLMQEIKKEKENEMLANFSFISYYKQLNEQVTVEQVKQEGEKRKLIELYRDTQDKDSYSHNNVNDDEEEEEEVQSDEDEIHENINRYNSLQKNSNKNKLKKFDQFDTLDDENTLNGFMTELQNDLSALKANYHAIKGIKHAQKHNSSSLLYQNEEFQNRDDDEELLNKQELNLTATSFKKYDNEILNNSEMRSAIKNIEKNIIIKKKKMPIQLSMNNTTQLNRTQKVNLSTHSSISSQSNIPIQSKTGLPIPRNYLLTKELKEFKQNLNDSEYLKKIGIGNTSINLNQDQHNFSSTQTRASSQMYNKTKMSRTTNLTVAMRPTKERSNSINKLTDGSITKKLHSNYSTQNSNRIPTDSKTQREKIENLDNSNLKLASQQAILSQGSPNKSIGIIYSNKNSKTKSKLIDAIAQGSKK